MIIIYQLFKGYKIRFSVLYPFQPSVVFDVETSHLIYCTNQMTGFYFKCNTGVKWVNPFYTNVLRENFPINSAKMQLAGAATSSIKKGVLKIFAKLTEKHLYQRPPTLLKRDSGIGAFL